MKSKIVTKNGKRYQIVPYADREHGGTNVNFLVPVDNWTRMKSDKKKELLKLKKQNDKEIMTICDKEHGGLPVTLITNKKREKQGNKLRYSEADAMQAAQVAANILVSKKERFAEEICDSQE